MIILQKLSKIYNWRFKVSLSIEQIRTLNKISSSGIQQGGNYSPVCEDMHKYFKKKLHLNFPFLNYFYNFFFQFKIQKQTLIHLKKLVLTISWVGWLLKNRHDITEILLKVALNTIPSPQNGFGQCVCV